MIQKKICLMAYLLISSLLLTSCFKKSTVKKRQSTSSADETVSQSSFDTNQVSAYFYVVNIATGYVGQNNILSGQSVDVRTLDKFNIGFRLNGLNFDTIKFFLGEYGQNEKSAEPYLICGSENIYEDCRQISDMKQGIVKVSAQAFLDNLPVSNVYSINVNLGDSNESQNDSQSNTQAQSQTETETETPALEPEDDSESIPKKNAAVADDSGSLFYPFDPAPKAKTGYSSKKVYAHYFSQFPSSISNKGPTAGYYEDNYLNPFGEGSKFASVGGFLRQKPIDRAVIPKSKEGAYNYNDPRIWRYDDFRFEVKMASQIGIDGFAINLLSMDESSYHWKRARRLLKIASEEGELNFTILMMPDMNALDDKIQAAENGGNDNYFRDKIITLARTGPFARTEDGKILIAPYIGTTLNHYTKKPQWWMKQLQKLEAYGMPAMMMPVFQGWKGDLDDFKAGMGADFTKYVYGVSDWGDRAFNISGRFKSTATEVHNNYGIKWMGPVAPQDYRPKSSTLFEAGNSRSLRNSFEAAIEGNADFVQLITWSDYSEASEIAPSSRTGYSFYDLCAYYIQWFKTGVKPALVRDRMLSFFRVNSFTVDGKYLKTQLASNSPQTSMAKWRDNTNDIEPINEIELLAFLTGPATLEIQLDQVYTKQVAEGGVVSFRVPMPALSILKANTINPVFRIKRDGQLISEMKSPWSLEGTPFVQNLLYHGMSSGRISEKKDPLSVSWPWRGGEDNIKPTVGFPLTSSPFYRKSNYFAAQFKYADCGTDNTLGYSYVPSGANRLKASFDLYIPATSMKSSNYEVAQIFLGDDDNDGVGFVLTSSQSTPYTSLKITSSKTGTMQELTNLVRGKWYQIYADIEKTSTGPESIRLTVRDEENKSLVSKVITLDIQGDLSQYNRLLVGCSLPAGQATALSIITDNVLISK